jgi:membrane protease YdiL (CAAX protease family)
MISPLRPAPFAAVIPALVFPLFGALLYFIACAGRPEVPFVYGAIKLAMIVWPLAVTARWGAPRWSDGLEAARLPRWRIAGEGLALGLAMAGAALALALGPLAGVLAAAAPRIAGKLADFHLASAPAYLGAALALSLAHSAFEEWYWRWFAYRQLQQRLPDGLAHALAGLAFAAHHCVIAMGYAGTVPGVLLGLVVGGAGMAWSALYRRHRSLLGAWIAHAICDLALMWLGWSALHPGSP